MLMQFAKVQNISVKHHQNANKMCKCLFLLFYVCLTKAVTETDFFF